MKRVIIASDISNNKMIITVFEGASTDGFIIDIIDDSGKTVFNQRYDYGRNAAHARHFATDAKPFASDIVDSLCEKYFVNRSNISVVPGKNVFRQKEVSSDVVNYFIDTFL